MSLACLFKDKLNILGYSKKEMLKRFIYLHNHIPDNTWGLKHKEKKCKLD